MDEPGLPEAPEPTVDPAPGPDAAERGARTAWRLAVSVLVVATAVALFFVGRAVLPGVGRATADAAAWAADTAVDGAGAAGDVWDGWATRFQEVAEAASGEPAEPVAPVTGSASALVVVADAESAGVAFALVAIGTDGQGTVMLAPPGLLSILPGYGDFPLADSVRFEGPELAALTLTNLLGVRIDEVVGLGPGAVEAALGGPVVLDLPTPLIVGQGDDGRVLASSGRAERPALIVEEVLTTQGLDDQISWLERQGAVWSSILDAVAADAAIAERLAAPAGARSGEVAAVLQAVALAADRNVTAVPVTRVAVGGDDTRYTLDADGESFVAARLGHLLIQDGPRPRVEILNGNGLVGTTRVVAEQLVKRGFRVVRTDNATSFDYELTQVVAQGRANRVAAESVVRLIGSGELLLELRNPSGVIDISIIVGQDVPAGESG